MHTTPRCILVDDNQDFLTVAERYLSMICPEFEVISFLDAFAALDFLKKNRVELLVTDFHMPSFDGLRLTRAVRAFDPDIPIVMMSGDAVEGDVLVSGVNAFVPKCSLTSMLSPIIDGLGLHAHA